MHKIKHLHGKFQGFYLDNDTLDRKVKGYKPLNLFMEK